jgi:hypothetical protein
MERRVCEFLIALVILFAVVGVWLCWSPGDIPEDDEVYSSPACLYGNPNGDTLIMQDGRECLVVGAELYGDDLRSILVQWKPSEDLESFDLYGANDRSAEVQQVIHSKEDYPAQFRPTFRP